MTEAAVLVDWAVQGGVGTITLDSPHNRNALSAALTEQLMAHLDRAAADPEVRLVVLTHTGGTFCAGADLTEARQGGMQQGTVRLLDLLRRIAAHPRPVVGVLDGHARAGGLGVLGACDAVIAGPKSTFAFTEVRLGLAPAIISLTTAHLLPARWAARYFLTGETFDAAEAARVGLITTAADDVEQALGEWIQLLRRSSPQGLAETKKLLTADLLVRIDSDSEQLIATSARLFGSEEAAEGMRAFAEKRSPRWVF